MCGTSWDPTDCGLCHENICTYDEGGVGNTELWNQQCPEPGMVCRSICKLAQSFWDLFEVSREPHNYVYNPLTTAASPALWRPQRR